MKQIKAVSSDSSKTEELLTIHFTDYGNANLNRVFEISDEIKEALQESRLGVFDGNMLAVDGSDGYLFLFGPDVRELYESIKPILLRTTIFKNADIRFGFQGGKKAIHEKLLQVS